MRKFQLDLYKDLIRSARKHEFYAWDRSYFYGFMWLTLKQMESYIIGENSHTIRSKQFKKRFKTAIEILRRLSIAEEENLDYYPFDHPIRPDAGLSHCTENLLEMLLNIIARDSLSWWD